MPFSCCRRPTQTTVLAEAPPDQPWLASISTAIGLGTTCTLASGRSTNGREASRIARLGAVTACARAMTRRSRAWVKRAARSTCARSRLSIRNVEECSRITVRISGTSAWMKKLSACTRQPRGRPREPRRAVVARHGRRPTQTRARRRQGARTAASARGRAARPCVQRRLLRCGWTAGCVTARRPARRARDWRAIVRFGRVRADPAPPRFRRVLLRDEADSQPLHREGLRSALRARLTTCRS